MLEIWITVREAYYKLVAPRLYRRYEAMAARADEYAAFTKSKGFTYDEVLDYREKELS